MVKKTKRRSLSEDLEEVRGVSQKPWRAGGMLNYPGKRKKFGDWWGKTLKHELYRMWSTMRKRCYSTKDKQFNNYGGRGITICERWSFFPNFVQDMGRRPKGFQIERINNDGNYEPGNCKWATPREQSNNKRCSRYLDFNGERMTAKQWADKLGVSYEAVMARLERGWSGKDTIAVPYGRRPPSRGRKLTDHQVIEIRASRDTERALASKFGLSRTAVIFQL